MRQLVIILSVLLWGCLAFGLRADINGDCRVDFCDLAILASEWMQEDEDCMANKYLQLTSGAGDISTGSFPDVGEGDFSLAAWVYLPSGYTGQEFFRKYKSEDQQGYSFGVWGDGNNLFLCLFLNNSSTVYAEAISTRNFNAEQWVHCVAVVDRTAATVVFYINGVAEDPISIAALSGTLTTTAYFTFPIFDPLSIDECAVVLGKLSQNDISDLYADGVGRKFTDLDFASVDGAYLNLDDDGVTFSARKVISGVGSDLVGGFSQGAVYAWIDGGIPLSATTGRPNSLGHPSGNSLALPGTNTLASPDGNSLAAAAGNHLGAS